MSSLIIILDLGVFCKQCCQMNLIEIFASTQIQDTKILFTLMFFIVYINVMYPRKTSICNIFCYA